MKDAVFLLLTLVIAVVLAAVSVIVQFETRLDPALLALLALGGGFAGWGLLEDRRSDERTPLDL